MTHLDRRLAEFAARVAAHTGWAHAPVRAYATGGIVVFAALLAAGLLVGRARGDAHLLAGVLAAGAGAVVALGANQLIGHAVNRARPYAAIPTIHPLVARTADFSFPSDHAAVAGAVAAGLWLSHPRLGKIAAAAAVALALARVYVGAHYPGDVVAGLAVGALAALAAHRLLVAPLARALALLARTRAGAFLIGRSPVVRQGSVDR